jgi:cold shock CspA family protein
MRNFETGTITNLGKSFGFICPDDKNKTENIFFHSSNLVEAFFRELKIGQVVAYQTRQNKKGQEAIKIEILLFGIKQNGK